MKTRTRTLTIFSLFLGGMLVCCFSGCSSSDEEMITNIAMEKAHFEKNLYEQTGESFQAKGSLEAYKELMKGLTSRKYRSLVCEQEIQENVKERKKARLKDDNSIDLAAYLTVKNASSHALELEEVIRSYEGAAPLITVNGDFASIGNERFVNERGRWKACPID
ncbi:hypothetical protein J7S19_11870 [Corynebacterium pyruviciproducens]|uniref:hypothetical protein n=1 Tax=Corynebacterium pyruviciproducens TaxID=598660 RepID=UPI0024557B70|nr:hypothetical protein [Corynebacterium pyruviciproducens]MDH4659280.1 hypothetical protein [Corynebacterium pyruviciproducens]